MKGKKINIIKDRLKLKSIFKIYICGLCKFLIVIYIKLEQNSKLIYFNNKTINLSNMPALKKNNIICEFLKKIKAIVKFISLILIIVKSQLKSKKI